jgi:hypothetical protein
MGQHARDSRAAKTTATRRRLMDVAFIYETTYFSIAKAHMLLRCPLCGFEVELTRGDVR